MDITVPDSELDTKDNQNRSTYFAIFYKKGIPDMMGFLRFIFYLYRPFQIPPYPFLVHLVPNNNYNFLSYRNRFQRKFFAGSI